MAPATSSMSTSRLEAFSDGVIAIIITIMILELKIPHGSDIHALRSLGPAFVAYVVSFIFLGIYWSNHHHMLQATEHTSGGILWANLHLLFWLSLVPAATAWVGENPRASWPAAVYGIVLFCSAVAYTVLQTAIVRLHGENSILAEALGSDTKGKLSLFLYFCAIGFAFVQSYISYALYIAVALMWLVPDPRIEKRLTQTRV